MTTKKPISAQQIALTALLVAIDIVLTRFLAVNNSIVKLNFSFLPLVIAAIYLGPVYTGVVAMLEDLIGPFLVAVGQFNPAFTIVAFLTGLTYGLFLCPTSPIYKGLNKFCLSLARVFHVSEAHRETFSLFAVSFIATFINLIVFSLIVNTFLIHHYFGYSYAVLVPTRIIKTAILLPLQTIMIPLIWTKLVPQLRRIPNF